MPVQQHCLGWSLQSRPIGRCNLRNSPVMPVRQHCLGWCGLQSGRCSTAWAEVFNPGRWMFGDTTNAYCACALLEFPVFNSGRACALYSVVGKKVVSSLEFPVFNSGRACALCSAVGKKVLKKSKKAKKCHSLTNAWWSQGSSKNYKILSCIMIVQ